MASTPMLKLMLSILLILGSIIIPSFSCPIHQKHALLHFKSTLTAIYNSKYSVKFVQLDSWNSTSDCCSWERVTCSRTGSVNELQLSGVAIPPPDVDPVSISSEILSPIFRIRSLELLDISENYFGGEIPGDGFGNLTKLVHLQMHDNYFNGSIPSQLFQLTNLRYLDMSENLLEGKLGPELGSFRKLTALWLSENHFQGPIPAQLFELESLRDLDLSSNNLGGSLSPEIGKLRNLESLSLGSTNFLQGKIPEEIGNLTKLRDFSLYNNSFSGGIPSSIANLTKLDWLDLSQNSLSLQIPTSIGRLTNLTSLYLRSNQLTGPIPSSIGRLTNLFSLALWSNQLTGPIPSSIGRLTNLTSLDLSSNQLTGPIPSSMQNLSKLESLQLNDNMLVGEIPTSLFKIRTLKGLYIGGKGSKLIWNNTTKVDPRRCSLQSISMPSCGISGQIPEWISSQKELWFLDLSGNKLPTQDRIIKWHPDKGMKCAPCGNVNDGHEHLFFKCSYSSKVWDKARMMCRIGSLDLEWKKILEELTELPNIKNIWIIVKKVVYAASVYFIWQERNLRLFQSIKREWEVLWKAIEENVKLKISSLMVLKSADVEDVYNVWGIEGDKDLSI